MLKLALLACLASSTMLLAPSSLLLAKFIPTALRSLKASAYENNLPTEKPSAVVNAVSAIPATLMNALPAILALSSSTPSAVPVVSNAKLKGPINPFCIVVPIPPLISPPSIVPILAILVSKSNPATASAMSLFTATNLS